MKPGDPTLATYTTEGANISQLVSLINISQQCEQFIKYECLDSTMHDAFWVSHNAIELLGRSSS